MMGLVPLQEEEETAELALAAIWEHCKKRAICKPGGQSSPEPDHAGTQILDF